MVAVAKPALRALLADVGLAFVSETNLTAALQACAAAVVKHLEATSACIWTSIRSGEELELKASAEACATSEKPAHRVRYGKGTIGEIAALRRPCFFSSAEEERSPWDWTAEGPESSATWAGYPLVIRSRVVGVLTVASETALSSDSLETLQLVAHHMALAIEQARVEDAYRWESTKSQALFDSNLMGVIVWKPGGEILEANDKFLNMVDYSRQELAAGLLRWSDITPSEYAELDQRAIADLRRTGRCTPFEKEYVRRDGSRFAILLGGVLLNTESDCGVAFVLDLTEVHRSEEAAYTLRAVVEGSNEAVIGQDLEGRVLSWNPAAERLYGYQADEILGKPVSLLVPADRAGESLRQLERVRRGERVPPLETVRNCKDGKEVEVSISLSPVYDKNGRLIAVSKFARDISEKRQLEEQFRQSQKMEAVGRLAGGIAHDFNNLLTAINGFSEIVLNKLDPEDASRGLVEEIRKAGDRAAALTRQLLAFSRKTVLEPQVLNLNDVIVDSQKMLERILSEHVTIVADLAADLGNVKADPHQIQHALMNLVVNAHDAMPTGGTLTLATANAELDGSPANVPEGSQPSRYAVISVSDTGTGMSEETRAQIFEPFFTTKPRGEGTGLGLAMVYGFVTQSGGRIRVYSQPGRGTTFEIYLPVVNERKSDAARLELKDEVFNGHETLLLAEDDESVLTTARYMLTAAGYTVLEARDGAAALELAKAYGGPIDLVVSDVVMPRMGGRLLAEAIETIRPGTKVLFLSGYTDDAVVRNGVFESEMPFLQKPFAAGDLCRKVREVLDSR